MSQFKNYVTFELFGDRGAYSYEDHLIVSQQTGIVIAEIVFALTMLVLPCFIAAKYGQGNELKNTMVMLVVVMISLFLFMPFTSVLVLSVFAAPIAYFVAVAVRKHNCKVA